MSGNEDWLLHFSADPQYFRLALTIKEYPDFLAEMAALRSIVFHRNIADGIGRNGRFRVTGGGTAAGGTHGLEQNGITARILEPKNVSHWSARAQIAKIMVLLGQPGHYLGMFRRRHP